MAHSFKIFIFSAVIAITAFGQDAPKSYTPNYRLRQYAAGKNPSADSLNANWALIDSTIFYQIPTKTRFVSPQFSTRPAPFYSTVSAAVAAADSGDAIYIYPGTYVENITVPKNHLSFIGSAPAPYYGSGVWGNGVRIQGKFDLGTHIGLNIRNISFDGNAGTVDIMTSTTSTQVNNSVIDNCIFANSGANQHQCLLQSGSGWQLNNLRFYDSQSGGHALALRCSRVNASNLYFQDINGTTSIIVKSDVGSGDARDINISNVTMVGTTLNAGTGIVIQSFNSSYVTQDVNISNVVAYGLGNLANQYGIVIEQNAGTCSNIHVENAIFEKSLVPFLFYSGSYISLVNCVATSASGASFQNDTATHVSALGCLSITPGGADYSGNFDIADINGSILRAPASPEFVFTASTYNKDINKPGGSTDTSAVYFQFVNGKPQLIMRDTKGVLTSYLDTAGNATHQNITSNGYTMSDSTLFLRQGASILNKAGNGWVAVGTRDTTGLSEANLSLSSVEFASTLQGSTAIGVGDSVQVSITNLTTGTGNAVVGYRHTKAAADTAASFLITAPGKLTLFGKFGWIVSYLVTKL